MRVEIGLLGGFTVSADGAAVPEGAWRRRHAAALVKLLALAPHRRLHRDRVVAALWPDADLDTALPRLHKAAHFARQALGLRDAVVLRGELVSLLPGVPVEVDVTAFESAADAALVPQPDSVERCLSAIALYRGELLPGDLNEGWSEEPRYRLRSRYLDLLRGARRWHDLLRLEPADEQAHLELLREAVVAGDRATALRRYEEMERVLERDLGVAPSPEAVALRERVLAPHPPTPPARDPATASPASLRTRYASAETLLERDGELAQLHRTVRSVVRTGRGTVVLVTGEAGSGKSALTRAFLDGLDDDVVVALGGCDDLLAPRSLGPFRDMVDSLPGLATALSASSHPDEVFPALLRCVAAAPAVIVVEDVHWADDVTLDAIRYLSRRLPGVPSILLLTFRDEDIDAAHPLRRILGGLSSSSIRRVELEPLSVTAVSRLAGVDDAEAAEIHRITRGNPFFVTEVLEAGGGGVPPTVRDAVLARLGRLPANARRLAELLAVVPSRAERWLAEALAGNDADIVLQVERSGVLTGGPEHVSFRHELARRAVEASLTVGERVQANREVLDVLLRQDPVEPSRIVHHAVRAVRSDLVVEYGPVAAAESEREGAHRQAAETLRVVLQNTDRLDALTRARLLTQRAYSLYVVNEYEAALPDAESAVAVAGKAEDPVVLAEALMVLARIVLFARGPMRAREAARRAVEILESAGDEARLAAALIELARTHSNLATVGVVAEPMNEAVQYAERALELARRLHRDDLHAQALWYLGSGRLAHGDARGVEDVEHAVAIAAADTRLETRVRSYVNAAGSAYRAGRFPDAERYIAAGLRLAADGEFAAGQYRLQLTSAAVHASKGEWDRAIAELQELVTSPGEPGVMGLLARSLLARLLARRGDPEAGAVLAAALSDPIGTGDSYVAGPLAVAEVEVGWLAGTLDRVPPRVGEALELAVASEHAAIQGELCVYLRRAGLDVPPSVKAANAPGPWGPSLAGRWRDAAAAWHELGERYEEAVELVCGDDEARRSGLAMLRNLGAAAVMARLGSAAGG